MKIVVQEWQCVVRYRDGVWQETLGPGRHRRRRFHNSLVVVDQRPRLLMVPTQEVLTADGLSVKFSVIARIRITDPRQWHESVADPEGFAYAAVQIALRGAVASRTLEELLVARTELGDELRSSTEAQLAEIGLAADDVAIRDLVVPAELRQAAADVAVARSQGLAALERARSEVAANRALANAARVLADNPALMQLRTLQAVESGRATVVLTTSAVPGAVGVSV